MRFPHRLLAVVLICAALAWFSGPAGRLLVVLPLLLFGPGYLVERWLAASDDTSLAQRPALWLGLSLSLIALLYQWATALGLSLTTPVLAFLAVACALGVAWRFLRPTTDDRRPTPDSGKVSRSDGPWSVVGRRWSVALLAILVLTLWTRFEQIKGLALPPWVDSVHHALLIRVAAEHGQFPYSLRPYLPIDQLPYHWGYHVFVAATMQLSGLALPQAMLWSGQVLNALAALTAAALAAHCWRHPLAGVVAALVVGLVSIMPAYYLSWGRYTQLAGLLLLPPLAIAWRAGLHRPSHGRFACVTLLLAGLSLIHFRVLVFALAFMAVSAAIWAYGTGWAALRLRLGSMAASAIASLVLTIPWLVLLAAGRLAPAIDSPQQLVARDSYAALTDGLLWAGQNRWLFALALAAALWGVARRRLAAAEQAGWVAALVLLANPVLVGLPYLWLITNDIVVISLFVPASVLIGGGACWLVEWIGAAIRRLATLSSCHRVIVSPRLRSAILMLVLGALALWGAWGMRSVVNPDTILATSADVAAIDWAQEHTPADARFLINATPWLSSQRGTDGGWWLLPLAGRWTSTPPVLFVHGSPEYVRDVRAIGATVSGYQTGREQQIYDLIAREKISYIYLGNRAGPLTAAVFVGNPAFEKVYEQDGVTILAVHL